MGILESALKYYGLKEVEGSGSNSVILDMIQELGYKDIKDDSNYAWCSVFLMKAAKDAGIKNNATPAARSWLREGELIANNLALDPGVMIYHSQVRPGDLMISYRGKRDGWKGHVTLFINWTDETQKYYRGFGGNQNNSAKISTYATSKLLGIRRL